MREVPARKAYRLLEASPVLLLTTAHEGRANVMTMTFYTMVRHDPPLVAIGIGDWDHSYAAFKTAGECVLAIPGVDLMRKAVDIGNCSGRDTDKLAKFKLATAPAKRVSAPLITDCLANLECELEDGALSDKYDLHILRVRAIWVNDTRKERRIFHHNGDGTFAVSGRTIDLKRRMTMWKEYQVDI